jgi:hypothetical protein
MSCVTSVGHECPCRDVCVSWDQLYLLSLQSLIPRSSTSTSLWVLFAQLWFQHSSCFLSPLPLLRFGSEISWNFNTLSHWCFYKISRCFICSKTSSKARHTCIWTFNDWRKCFWSVLYSYDSTPLARGNRESAWTASFSTCCLHMYDVIITLLCPASHVLHRLTRFKGSKGTVGLQSPLREAIVNG